MRAAAARVERARAEMAVVRAMAVSAGSRGGSTGGDDGGELYRQVTFGRHKES